VKLTAIHHVAIWVSNLEQAKDFYVTKLGFAVIRENARADQGDVKLDVSLGDTELELFCAQGHPPRRSYPEALGLRHLAFRVDNIDEAVAWLAGMNIITEPVRVDAYMDKRMTFFFDPDGQPLELHE